MQLYNTHFGFYNLYLQAFIQKLLKRLFWQLLLETD